MLDICEIQGVPVIYEKGLFMLDRKNITLRWGSVQVERFYATQNVETVLLWLDQCKKRGKKK